jgi:pyruvate dehydrogenase E2 component (dihydrolipoamide acetyltransferase)
MAKEIIMPKLSDTMEEGTFISWKKGVGDKVERGDIVAEVETDKANMELEAFDSGVLLEIRAKAGDVVPVGTVIGLIGEPGERPASKPGVDRVIKEVEAKKPPAEEEEVSEIEEKKAVATEMKKIAEPAHTAEYKEEAAGPTAEKQGEIREELAEAAAGEEKASPMVRRLAREQGVDLGDVRGTGPEGRILREDLDKFLKERGTGKEVSLKPGMAGPETPSGKKLTEPLSRMRAAIARNVAVSWRTIPHFSVSVPVDMGEAERLQRGVREAGVSLSINDVIIKAAAAALRKYPRLNASFSDDGIILYPEINIGVAVSVEDGLLVPVVRGCEKLALKELAARSRDLIDKARQGKISEQEISGGTFTVSNLGMFGVEAFSAVIYPGQAAILAVAAIHDTAVAGEEGIVKGRVMNVTLSADHRIVDGAYAARFLSELKKTLENPFSMLV